MTWKAPSTLLTTVLIPRPGIALGDVYFLMFESRESPNIILGLVYSGEFDFLCFQSHVFRLLINSDEDDDDEEDEEDKDDADDESEEETASNVVMVRF